MILDQCQLKLKGNQDANLITESAVLEINEANKIRELYRTLREIPETEKGKIRNRIEKFRKKGKQWGEFPK